MQVKLKKTNTFRVAYEYTVFVGDKAAAPRRPHPDFGEKNKTGEKIWKKVEHLSVILVKVFQLWPYKYMAQVPRISNGINYKSDHRITSKTKRNQHVKACMGLCTEHL